MQYRPFPKWQNKDKYDQVHLEKNVFSGIPRSFHDLQRVKWVKILPLLSYFFKLE